MAFKTVKARVDHQVTELVNNINGAVSTQSEQKRDYFTAKAMYYAQRLNKTLSEAKITAAWLALVFCVGMASCQSGTETSTVTTDSTAVTIDTAGTVPMTDTTATPVVDSAK